MTANSTPEGSLRVLEAIRTATTAHGYPPTVGELKETLGYRSKATVVFHLNRLVLDGLIRRDPGVARGIVLLDPTDTPEETDRG